MTDSVRSLLPGSRTNLRVRSLEGRRRGETLAYLRSGFPDDLLLFDLVAGLPEQRGTAAPVHGVGVWRDDALIGVALLQPSVLLDSQVEGDAVEALCGPLESLQGGLLKSAEPQAGAVWRRLKGAGRRAILDRMETGLLVRESRRVRVSPPTGGRLRPASANDLDALVEIARASLREEERPDPGEVDPHGFRRWVRTRLPRARVLDVGGKVAFVGYADVCRVEGWLVQGVYTMPHLRGRGLAAAGMSALVDEALEDGADHVQLTVIDGNEPALRLYRGLGFETYGRVRTILFS